MLKPDWKCVFTYVQSFYRRFRHGRDPPKPTKKLTLTPPPASNHATSVKSIEVRDSATAPQGYIFPAPEISEEKKLSLMQKYLLDDENDRKIKKSASANVSKTTNPLKIKKSASANVSFSTTVQTFGEDDTTSASGSQHYIFPAPEITNERKTSLLKKYSFDEEIDTSSASSLASSLASSSKTFQQNSPKITIYDSTSNIIESLPEITEEKHLSFIQNDDLDEEKASSLCLDFSSNNTTFGQKSSELKQNTELFPMPEITWEKKLNSFQNYNFDEEDVSSNASSKIFKQNNSPKLKIASIDAANESSSQLYVFPAPEITEEKKINLMQKYLLDDEDTSSSRNIKKSASGNVSKNVNPLQIKDSASINSNFDKSAADKKENYSFPTLVPEISDHSYIGTSNMCQSRLQHNNIKQPSTFSGDSKLYFMKNEDSDKNLSSNRNIFERQKSLEESKLSFMKNDDSDKSLSKNSNIFARQKSLELKPKYLLDDEDTSSSRNIKKSVSGNVSKIVNPLQIKKSASTNANFDKSAAVNNENNSFPLSPPEITGYLEIGTSDMCQSRLQHDNIKQPLTFSEESKLCFMKNDDSDKNIYSNSNIFEQQKSVELKQKSESPSNTCENFTFTFIVPPAISAKQEITPPSTDFNATVSQTKQKDFKNKQSVRKVPLLTKAKSFDNVFLLPTVNKIQSSLIKSQSFLFLFQQ